MGGTLVSSDGRSLRPVPSPFHRARVRVAVGGTLVLSDGRCFCPVPFPSGAGAGTAVVPARLGPRLSAASGWAGAPIAAWGRFGFRGCADGSSAKGVMGRA
ncbi:hypothetical protein SALBM311S_11745 [Streptomyces alboniger]